MVPAQPVKRWVAEAGHWLTISCCSKSSVSLIPLKLLRSTAGGITLEVAQIDQEL